MPVPFGFGVGDFIAVGKLLVDIYNALRDSKSICNEYRSLMQQLDSLHKVMKGLRLIVLSNQLPNSTSNAIKEEVKICQDLMRQFLQETEEYRDSLNRGACRNKVKDAWKKMSWGLFKKEDVQGLRESLRVHTDCIMMWIMMGGSLPKAIDQQSLHIHDALGRQLSFPLFLCSRWKNFQDTLEISFRGLPGSKRVGRGEFTINAAHGTNITASEWGRILTPGMIVTMSMIVRQKDRIENTQCPSCKTYNNRATGSNQSIQCFYCQVIFRVVPPASREPEARTTMETIPSQNPNRYNTNRTIEHTNAERSAAQYEENEIPSFRRIEAIQPATQLIRPTWKATGRFRRRRIIERLKRFFSQPYTYQSTI